jgi:hypothetical protein
MIRQDAYFLLSRISVSRHLPLQSIPILEAKVSDGLSGIHSTNNCGAPVRGSSSGEVDYISPLLKPCTAPTAKPKPLRIIAKSASWEVPPLSFLLIVWASCRTSSRQGIGQSEVKIQFYLIAM